tara:strand:- start:568 stop:1176 length:609 start_codon:yes stop_codon:yes gene_type:complete
MQNLFAGFFVSLLIHTGLVLSLSNIFNIDLLNFQAEYAAPIPAYLVFEQPALTSKKEFKRIVINDVTPESKPKIDIKEMVLKPDQEILILESKATKPSIVKKNKINLSEKNRILFFSSIIEGQIRTVWKKPIVPEGLSVELVLSMVPTGEILDVKIKRPSGNEAFDRSALIAVAKVKKFENLSMSAKLFDDNFRNFSLIFRP